MRTHKRSQFRMHEATVGDLVGAAVDALHGQTLTPEEQKQIRYWKNKMRCRHGSKVKGVKGLD